MHEQKVERNGQLEVAALRATVPAEMFFSGEYIVDSTLKSEFFKHLPGIFTGIGIIGTFIGLIFGLQAFEVSESATEVRSSLESLLHGVFEAFLISAFAIALAMISTFIEKIQLAALYNKVEEIAQYLDGLFVAGAGEEYLSRLVNASEDSASQAKILKDSLVGELKTMLHELTERQISAYTQTGVSLSTSIAKSISESMKEPLEGIKALVTTASGDQSAAASEMLKDVMASFSQRLNELFGGQISGIQELNQKSAQAMQDAVTGLQRLIGDIESKTKSSSEDMATRMAQAVEEMERRQADINEQTKDFVEQIRALVNKSQAETNDKLRTAMEELGNKVNSVLIAVQKQTEEANAQQGIREKQFTAHATGAVTALGESVSSVVQQIAEATAKMQKSIEALERTTTNSIDKMSSGAQTLERGAVAFAKAGENVTGAMTQAATVAGKMTEVSGSLTSSSSALQQVVNDYRASREATALMLAEVKNVIERAKREASLTEEILRTLNVSADKLSSAQRSLDTYLDGVSGVLAESQEAFNDGLTRTLERANTDFHKKLTAAVSLLNSALEELEITLSNVLPPRR